MSRNRRLLPIPTLEFENYLWKAGFNRIAGIDEAGRGAWAGPVVAACVILPVDPTLTSTLDGVRDSKLMTPVSRETWSARIKECAICWGIGIASSGEIDSRGIVPATKMACERALAGLGPDYLLTDYLLIREMDLPQTALVKGDQRSLSVAAASVLAKISRDAMMRELDGQFPGYDFARHKGYGTPQHAEALIKLHRCRIHRFSFSIP